MKQYKDKFIGEKKIADVVMNKDKTVTVEYADGAKELLSSLMFDVVVTDEHCDLSVLRDKRLQPIVEEILSTMRNWGLRLSEYQHLIILLNGSIQFNESQALIELWSKRTNSRLLSPDDVDMMTIDKILKEVKSEDRLTIDDVINQNKTE